MANWLEELVNRVAGRVMADDYPGFTQSRMMANQGPMGTPMQSPDQYDIPYRAPYGGGGFIQESDLSAPLGASRHGSRIDSVASEVERRDIGSPYANPYTLGYNYPHQLNRPQDHGQRRDFLDYDPTVSNETARQIMLDAAKRQAIARLLSSGSR